jgi:hypothetical protein
MCVPEAFQEQLSKFAPKQSRWRFVPSARSSKWTKNLVPWLQRKESIRKKISQLLESYRREDPPSKPKLAVPLSVPNYLVLAGLTSNDPKRRAVGNMATIAFHYLLRRGEYTFVNPNQRRQTKQSRVCDVIFWIGNTILPHSLPLKTLLRDATEGTLNISNQKNGKRAQTIHQEVTGTPPYPVHALIRQVKQIIQYTQGRALWVGCITRASKQLFDISDSTGKASARPTSVPTVSGQAELQRCISIT